MTSNKEQIVKEVMEAVECARRCEPHPRLNTYIDRSIDEFYRRAALRCNRTPVIINEAKQPAKSGETTSYDPTFRDDSFGAGGAKRSD